MVEATAGHIAPTARRPGIETGAVTRSRMRWRTPPPRSRRAVDGGERWRLLGQRHAGNMARRRPGRAPHAALQLYIWARPRRWASSMMALVGLSMPLSMMVVGHEHRPARRRRTFHHLLQLLARGPRRPAPPGGGMHASARPRRWSTRWDTSTPGRPGRQRWRFDTTSIPLLRILTGCRLSGRRQMSDISCTPDSGICMVRDGVAGQRARRWICVFLAALALHAKALLLGSMMTSPRSCGSYRAKQPVRAHEHLHVAFGEALQRCFLLLGRGSARAPR